MIKKSFLFLFAAGLSLAGIAQLDSSKQTPESTEIWDPVPRVVTPGALSPDAKVNKPPSDAIVLFDGANLDQWTSAKMDNTTAPWLVEDGIITVKPRSGDIRTKKEFDDFQLHIEFRPPAKVSGSGQGRGNSGIFLQGLYELQVLDSYNNLTYSNGQAGSIYKQSMPMVNACLPPGTWQTYDVVFTAPKYNKDGMMVIPPYVTVLQNGILVQNHTAIRGTTPYVGLPELTPHEKGPIRLQDHNNSTSFRNIWIREI
ncbi:MAG: DUF1080 domain-containing protein [Flavitalea sp.]